MDRATLLEYLDAAQQRLAESEELIRLHRQTIASDSSESERLLEALQHVRVFHGLEVQRLQEALSDLEKGGVSSMVVTARSFAAARRSST
jgi:hypothetical protein